MHTRFQGEDDPPTHPPTHSKAYYMYIASNLWLAMRLEFVGPCLASPPTHPPTHPPTSPPLQAYYMYIASNRWLAMRLEFVGACIVSLAGIFSIVGREHGVTAGKGGLSISYALSITQTLNWMVRMTSEVETNVVGTSHPPTHLPTHSCMYVCISLFSIIGKRTRGDRLR